MTKEEEKIEQLEKDNIILNIKLLDLEKERLVNIVKQKYPEMLGGKDGQSEDKW